MLSRRILRIKAFKAVYGIAENPSVSMKETEAGLEKSCEATRDLYLFLLALAPALRDEAQRRIEAGLSKFNPTSEELHPNTRFVENRLSPLLAEDPDFAKILSRKKLSWEQYDAFLRHLYESVSSEQYFRDYLVNGEPSLAKDAALYRCIYENELEDNEELAAILEDLSIWWNDDLAYSLTWCCKTMESLGKGKPWNLPPLFLSDMDETHSKESDKAFVVNLLRKAYTGYDRYVARINEVTPKWDLSRICSTDLSLIVCGMAESEAFPGIAPKVTINEFVEISKYYSTPESRAFVNGILDKLINK